MFYKKQTSIEYRDLADTVFFVDLQVDDEAD